MNKSVSDVFFSIVIPTYNRAESLRKTLDSLVSQTYKKFEVIVCDDGSVDNTKEIVAFYENLISIKYIYQTNWGGPAKPRNIGIANSKYEWICFLDSDDFFLPEKLEVIKNKIADNVDFIYHDLSIMKNDKISGKIKARSLGIDPYHDLMFNLNAIPTSSVCVRKEVLIQYGRFSENKDLIAVEDFDLWLRLAKQNTKFLYLPKVLGIYNLGTNNITLYNEVQIERIENIYRSHIRQEERPDVRKKTEAALNYQIARIYSIMKQYKKSSNIFIDSLKYGTFSLKIKSIFWIIKNTFKIIKN